jgi:hypothetical protein
MDGSSVMDAQNRISLMIIRENGLTGNKDGHLFNQSGHKPFPSLKMKRKILFKQDLPYFKRFKTD